MNIDVTRGEKEYVVGKVTEKNGRDLAEATFMVGLGKAALPPTTWQAPDLLEVNGAVAVVSLLVDEIAQIGDKQYLWVKVTDNPEVIFLRASSGTTNITVT